MGCRGCEENKSNKSKEEIVNDSPIMIRFASAVGDYLKQLCILGDLSKNNEDKLKYYTIASHDAMECVGWLIQIMNGGELKARGATNTEDVIKRFKYVTAEFAKQALEMQKRKEVKEDEKKDTPKMV